MRHSKSWIYQTYVAFSASILGMAYAIYSSPLTDSTKVWMGMCYLFAISTTLTLSKTLRDVHEDTFGDKLNPLWMFQSWLFFLIAVGGFVWGLYYLPFDQTAKVMIGVVMLFGLSASSAFAKTVRDVQELERNATTKAIGPGDHPSIRPS